MEKFIAEPRFIPVDFDPFAGPAIKETIPTTEAQQEVMLAAGMGHDASCAYIESVSLELTGALDRPALSLALEQLVARHDALRSTLSATGTRMLVAEHMSLDLPFIDLASLSEKERSKKLDALATQDMEAAFDLQNGPLFRVKLIRTAAETHSLRLSAHHVICDGWSLGIMMAEISTLYTANRNGVAPQLPEAIPYGAYALATMDAAKSAEQAGVERYWTELFQGHVAALELPTDHPRPRQKTYRGQRLDLDLPPELVRSLKETATRSGASFVTTLLTTFELFLHKLTGETDMVVGLPAAGQSDLGMKHLVGHCVNLLALRSRIDEERSFIDHLKQRRTAILDAFDHQKYTFGTLLKKLNLPRVPGRIPLVPVVFNIDMNMDDGVAFDDLTHRFISNPRRYENFELFLNATGKNDHLTLEWSFNADLFDRSTIHTWMDEFTQLIQRICAKPEARIGDLTGDADLTNAGTLPPVEWYGTAVPYPRNKSVSALFDETVAAYPEQVAICHGELVLTYSELSKRVMALTASLTKAGVRSGDLVGLCCERNFGMVVAQLAIMRAGAAFVPIDHTYPEARIQCILEDIGSGVLLIEPALESHLPAHGARTVHLSLETMTTENVADVPAMDQPSSAAYVMYTSGSTGKPKGVVVPQRAIVRLVRNQNYAPFGPDAVITQLSNVSFDASTFELWGALLNGGKLVLQPQPKPTLREITDTMERHGVNIMFITTGLFNVLVDEQVERLRNLKCILTGGEAMSVTHITKALRVLGPGVLNNIYGPTENTTYSCFHPINSVEDIGRAVPIGKAINNTFIYVLDEHMKPVPVGVKGELYTGGDGVAIGYLNRPDLTAERFLPDPFLGGEARMYRSGDLVRWSATGSIEFLGRADDQVKVRGFRIELGEIEHAISAIKGVRDRVVMARRDMPGDQQLVAYVVPDEQISNDPKRAEAFQVSVREHLIQQLPSYMVPAFIMVLASLPLNPNGKVDKKQLPQPDLRSGPMTVQYVAPRTETEKQLARIWCNVLGTDDVGVHDSFFDVGGHSIAGIQVLTQIEQRFGKSFNLNAIFRSPTIAEFAQEISGAAVDGTVSDLENLTAIQPRGTMGPLICVHGDEANHYLPRYLGNDQPFYGYSHQGENGDPLRYRSVEAIATYYISQLKKLLPHGPYRLCGYSFGGLVAYEMGRQLLLAGESVPIVILLDTYSPELFVEVMNQERKIYEPVKRVVMHSATSLLRAMDKALPPKLRNFQIIDAYDQAIMAYHTKPYPGDVAVIKAVNSPGAEDMGWGKHVQGNLILERCVGDHYVMIKEPLVGQLAGVMQAILQRSKGATTLGVV